MESAAYMGEYRNGLLSKTAGKMRFLKSAIACLSAAASPRTFSREERAEQNLLAEKILDDYGNSILRLAYMYLHNRSDAEEILQDTLIRFLQTAPQFENEIHKKAWLLRVAGNLSKNRIEYNRVRNTEELNEELISEERDDLSFVWEAVKTLPVKYREVIHLFYQEGYQTAEIASILHENEATVRSYLNRGRAKLREVLKEAYDFA